MGDVLSNEEFDSFISEANVDSEGNFDYEAWISMVLK